MKIKENDNCLRLMQRNVYEISRTTSRTILVHSCCIKYGGHSFNFGASLCLAGSYKHPRWPRTRAFSRVYISWKNFFSWKKLDEAF